MSASKFRIGQSVMVLNAHACGAHDEGIITAIGKAKEYVGKYWVDIGGTKIFVEPERMMDSKDYYTMLREARANTKQ